MLLMSSTDTPTMVDIARRVGVHRVTVSNVLNGKLKSTRSDAAVRAAEIRRVARDMGYRPSAAARTVATGRTGLIGMLRSPEMRYSVHVPQFDIGVDRALHARGLCLVRDLMTPGGPVPRIVREDTVDGLIVNYAFGTPEPVRELLDRCAIPAVWVNRKRDSNCVRPKDEGAARDATRVLLNLGHTDITFVSIDSEGSSAEQEPHYSGLDRFDGYRQAMQAAGLKPRHASLRQPQLGTPGFVGGMLDAYRGFLQRPGRPTAVLCNVGGRVMRLAACQLGVRVPDELSILTFDSDVAADARVGVDRLLVRYEAMGRATVQELEQLIDEPSARRAPVLLPFEFHRAGTVARPRIAAT
jgi:LacI family transcriptional regulator